MLFDWQLCVAPHLFLLDSQHGFCPLEEPGLHSEEDSHSMLRGSRWFNEDFGLASSGRYVLPVKLTGALEDWVSFLTLRCDFCVICGISRQFDLPLTPYNQVLQLQHM